MDLKFMVSFKILITPGQLKQNSTRRLNNGNKNRGDGSVKPVTGNHPHWGQSVVANRGCTSLMKRKNRFYQRSHPTTS